MERPSPNVAVIDRSVFLSLLLQQKIDPMQHFRCGASGECQKENPSRRDAPVDQSGDAMHERLGFSGPGSSDDEQRSAGMLDRPLLLWIEHTGIHGLFGRRFDGFGRFGYGFFRRGCDPIGLFFGGCFHGE